MGTPVLKTADVNKYAFYGFTSFLVSTMAGSYMQLFMTDNLLISAAMAAFILTLGRGIDFIACALTGAVMEKVRLREGKYRSWVNILRWVVLGAMIAMFLNTAGIPVGLRAAVCLAAYLGMNLSMNFIGTAASGILTLLAGPSQANRNKLAIRQNQFMVAAQIVIAAGAIPFLNLTRPLVGNNNAYTVLALVLAAVFFLGMSVLSGTAKPYDRPEAAQDASGQTPVTIGDMVRAVVTNNQLLIFLLAQTLFMAGSFGIQPLGAYYFIYVLGDFNLMTKAMTITTSLSLLAAIVGPILGVKLGKKRAMITGLLIASMGGCGIAAFGHLGLTVYVTLLCINMLGTFIFAGFGVNYILDCGEYGFWQTGKDNRTVLMAMFNLPMKFGIFIGGGIGAFGFAAIGYKAGEDPLLIPNFAKNFMLILGGAPALFYSLSALLMGLGYRITDADAAKYARENAEGKAGQAREALKGA
jgi:GPH family glycoside/pentoside/hexuronide:cation symporter